MLDFSVLIWSLSKRRWQDLVLVVTAAFRDG